MDFPNILTKPVLIKHIVNSQILQIADLDKQIKKSHAEISELQDFIFKSAEDRRSPIDDIYIKISEVEKERKIDQSNMNFDLQKFEKKQNDLEFEFKAFRDESNAMKEQIKKNDENIFKANQNSKEMKDQILLKIQETYEKIFTQIEGIQRVSNTADQQSKVNKAKINTMDAQIQSDRKQIESHSKSLLKIESRIETINQVTVKEKKYKEDIADIEEVIKNLQVKENDFTNHLATVENYVEKYLPVQIQTQVGEALKGTLSQKEGKKFEDNQKKIFERLNKLILLDDGVPEILSRIVQTRNLINYGEIQSKGAMYNIVDPKMVVNHSAHNRGDSPAESEVSHAFNLKTGTKHDTLYGSPFKDKNDKIPPRNQSSVSQKKIPSNFHKNSTFKEEANSYRDDQAKPSKPSSKNISYLPSRREDSVDDLDLSSDDGSIHHLKSVSKLDHSKTKQESIDEHSDRDLEEFLFGENEDEDIPPRVETMSYPDITRYLIGYIKIKEKKNKYQKEQFSKTMTEKYEEMVTKLDKVSNEAREYNMTLHTELEQFMTNKKKEFYQKFVEIKETKEEQQSIKEAFDDNTTTQKHISVVLSCLVESLSIVSRIIKQRVRKRKIQTDLNISKTDPYTSFDQKDTNPSSLLTKSFLPSMPDRHPSHPRPNQNAPSSQSRNLSKELFKPPRSSSLYFSKPRGPKPKFKEDHDSSKHGLKFRRHLKTPDIKAISSTQDSAEKPSVMSFAEAKEMLVYRNKEFSAEDLFVMLTVMNKKCNDIIHRAGVDQSRE